ncbi:MAG: inorganic phosphate transporter [Dehalococcoidia bacterium]|nr:inorganic phosphate transporter [Dehalococcoidia bacterium]
MPESLALLVLVITVAIGFGVANGFNDAANAIATVIGTRTLSPRAAIIMAAFCNFAGAATGTAVAMTIGKGIVASDALTLTTIIAGAGAIVIWAVVATRYGMPISLTHGLVAGLVGAGIAISGSGAIVWGVLTKVISAVGIAPLVGFGGGFLVMVVIMWLFRRSAPEAVQSTFGNLQILSAAFMAYSHGKNDGQMPIGLITMALVAFYQDSSLWDRLSLLDPDTWWIIVIAAASISFGTAIGGWRVIRTLGLRMTTLRPVHGFAATAAAATVIEVASHFGIPVSTTHCMSSSVMGVGATRRLSAVRWGIARSIVLTWILTFPACGILGWLIASLLQIAF